MAERMDDPIKILVTGANGQVGHELLRALTEKPSPSVALCARSLRSALPAEGGRETRVHHPLRNEVGRAQSGGNDTPLRNEAGRAQPGGNDTPLRDEAGRAQPGGNHTPFRRKGVAPEARGDVPLPCEIIPATRDGRLEGGEACERIDLADFDDLREALDRIAPALIVNAAAYTAVDRAEDEPELARRVNADAVGVIGAWAAAHAARVVHYSTDYVFDGAATRPYREDDATHPLGVYGRTKLAGETALRDSGARHLILRTAWVYGPRGSNFLRTMLRLGAERDELRVVDDQIGAPTSAELIADVTAQMIRRWFAADQSSGRSALDGTYHLVASGQTSWCGFARAIFERAALATPFHGSGVAPQTWREARSGSAQAERERAIPLSPPSQAKGEEVEPIQGEGERKEHPLPKEGGRREAPGGCGFSPRVIAITTADFPTKAKRPAYSVLDTSKLRNAFHVDLPDWQTALDRVVSRLRSV